MSGATEVSVWNLALVALGTSLRVDSPTEQSKQAQVCADQWDRARLWTLERAYWPFAAKAAPLSLLLDQQTLANQSQWVAPGWRYIYARPVDCVRAQAVTTWLGLRIYPWLSNWWINPAQNPAPMWGPYRPPWAEMADAVNNPPGQSVDIVTDQESAFLVYTIDAPIALWSETMIDCVALQLAVRIYGPLSASGIIVKDVKERAQQALSTALEHSLNEQQPDAYPDSPSILARQ